jgi:hypothetical protein
MKELMPKRQPRKPRERGDVKKRKEKKPADGTWQ